VRSPVTATLVIARIKALILLPGLWEALVTPCVMRIPHTHFFLFSYIHLSETRVDRDGKKMGLINQSLIIEMHKHITIILLTGFSTFSYGVSYYRRAIIK
jgi:hypothetical protein